MAPFKWDADADFKLLLAAVVHLDAKVPSAFFENFARDKAFNSNAAYQRFYKLKREAETILSKSSDGSTGDAAAADPSTPAGKKTKAAPKKSSVKSTKRKNDNDDEVTATPTKKGKSTKAAETVDAAAEGEDEADDAETAIANADEV